MWSDPDIYRSTLWLSLGVSRCTVCPSLNLSWMNPEASRFEVGKKCHVMEKSGGRSLWERLHFHLLLQLSAAHRPRRGVEGWDGACCPGDRRPHVLRASLRSKGLIVLALSCLRPPSRLPSLPLSVHPTMDGNKQLVQPLGRQRWHTHTLVCRRLLRGHTRPDVSGKIPLWTEENEYFMNEFNINEQRSKNLPSPLTLYTLHFLHFKAYCKVVGSGPRVHGRAFNPLDGALRQPW